MASLDDDDDDKEEQASWLATFADLSTLLLTFFILLYSMSTVDAQKFEATFSSVRDSFGGDTLEHIKIPESNQDTISATLTDLIQAREDLLKAQLETYNQIRSFITQQSMDEQIQSSFDDGKIILRVPSDILFDRGSEYLSARAESALYTLLQIFHEKREQSINVKGYSDNSPVPRGARFYDNWELSALRAVNVLRYYLAAGVQTHRIIATGMGELDPLFPNDTESNKEKNRRVEFVLERIIKKDEN